MNPELGRFFEGRLLETQKLLRALYDLGTGAGQDVVAAVDGRELVFSRGDGGARGFLRLTPSEVYVVLAFPRGAELFDPAHRLKGPSTGQRSLVVGAVWEIDPHVRRLVDAAYQLG